MINRWLGIAFGALLLLADAVLVQRDIIDHRLLGNPPSRVSEFSPGEKRFTQVGIYDAAGNLLGTSWTRASKATAEVTDLVTVVTTTVLKSLDLPGGLHTPPVRVESTLAYRHGEQAIDNLEFHMIGLGLPISLKAEAVGTDFALRWQVGETSGTTVIDSRIPATLGDVIRPFDELPDLYVGRKWKLDLVDVAGQIIPKLGTQGIELEPVVIEVTRQETIEHHGKRFEAFVVEGGGAIAWVSIGGKVLRQKVTLPLLGELTLLDEDYDKAAWQDAVHMVPELTTQPRGVIAEPDFTAPTLRARPPPKPDNQRKTDE